MPRHFTASFSDNPRPSGDISAMVARWREQGVPPPVTLQPMPDRVPPARGWIEVAAAITLIVIVGIIGAGLWGRI